VIDASWAGDPESQSHLHCYWPEVKFAKLSQTSDAVQKNIKYRFQLAFFENEGDAKKGDNNDSLFWFYIADETHKACQTLELGKVVDLSK
jgi:hypothetical protein